MACPACRWMPMVAAVFSRCGKPPTNPNGPSRPWLGFRTVNGSHAFLTGFDALVGRSAFRPGARRFLWRAVPAAPPGTERLRAVRFATPFPRTLRIPVAEPRAHGLAGPARLD